jgi:signal recognition particle GTPase
MEYQYRVCAWAAVRILGEQAAPLPWDLHAGTTLESVRCENRPDTTDDLSTVDDVILETSTGGRIFVQAKRRLHLGSTLSTEFGKTIQQFVGQFLAGTSVRSGDAEESRVLDSIRDRLVIAVGPGTSATVRTVLPALLRKAIESEADQSIDDQMNQEERQVLGSLTQLITSAYLNHANRSPDDDDIRKVLSLLRLTVLDVEADGESEIAAKSLLSGHVLRDPTQAEAAWRILTATCGEYCSNRSGGSRDSLQKVLLSSGLDLRGVQSYLHDIELLQDYSRRKRELERGSQTIRTRTSEIHVERPVSQAVRELAEVGGIIVGEAGAGKTAALMGLFDSLSNEGREVVMLSADRIAAQSVENLQQELGLDHSLPVVLSNWSGLRSGYVLIDALDAGRLDERTARCLRDLIAEINTDSRWKIVAVIRKFDLRYSKDIQASFPGTPPTEFSDPEFQTIRHVNVGRLSDDELDAVKEQSPEMTVLINQANPELLELLRVPINLQLAGELLASGISTEALTPIRTQVQLLDKYWLVRAIGRDLLQDAREFILSRTVEVMMDARELRALRREVQGPDTASRALASLLSSHVLVEWQETASTEPNRDFLSFAHHVVFDYAVARLIFRHLTPVQLAARLSSNRDLLIAARPSLVMHFHYVWERDSSRAQFWNLVLHIARSRDVPEIGKLLGPELAANQARTLNDLLPLLDALSSEVRDEKLVAEHAVEHLANAFTANLEAVTLNADLDLQVWCELTEALSQSMTRQVAFSVRRLLGLLLKEPSVLRRQLISHLGHAARRLLAFSWEETPRNPWLANGAITSVCQTFGGDPDASASLLRRALESPHLEQYGYEEMPTLSREVKRLWPHDPDLVEDIDRRAFAFRELSDEATYMSGSRILSLSSTRRQDYEIALHRLTDAYPEFLSSSPEQGTAAMVSILESYAHHEKIVSENSRRELMRLFNMVPEKEPPEAVPFEFDGMEAQYLTDGSFIWGDAEFRHQHEEFRILAAFASYLSRLSEDDEHADLRRRLVAVIAAQARTAFNWKRLLVLGEQSPSTLGLDLQSLTRATPILMGRDTASEATRYLASVYPHLSVDQRELAELAIIALPEGATSPEQRLGLERIRDRHLARLPLDLLITEAARRLVESQPGAHEDQDGFEVTDLSGQFGTAIGHAPAESGPSSDNFVLSLEAARRWASTHSQGAPEGYDVVQILPTLQAIKAEITRTTGASRSTADIEQAWDMLADALERIAATPGLDCDSAVGRWLRAVLIAAADRVHPDPSPTDDEQFDTEHIGWDGPAARREAALGLLKLLMVPACVSDEVLEALDRLSQDVVASVRFFVIGNAHLLLPHDQELMWTILERATEGEARLAIRHALVTGPLAQLAQQFPDRTAQLVARIFVRSSEEQAIFVREACVHVATSLFVAFDQSIARDFVVDAVGGSEDLEAYGSTVARVLRGYVSPHISVAPNVDVEAIKRRAIWLLDQLNKATVSRLRALGFGGEMEFDGLDSEVQDRIRSLLKLLDSIAMEIYFTSGVHDFKSNSVMMPLEKKQEFLHETESAIDELTQISLPHATQVLVEMLDYLAEVDPRGVFLKILKMIRASESYGYQYEGMAVELVVKVVERYLADYRAYLRESPECREALIDVLDVFVRAGWPQAISLSYRLNEIYR